MAAPNGVRRSILHDMRLRSAVAAVLALVVAGPALAVAPPTVEDAVLAKSAVVVVARWDGEPIRWRDGLYDGADARIVVERSIAGGLAPGTHAIRLGPGLGWGPEGRLIAHWSTEMWGEIDDVSQPNLWFLRAAREGDAASTTEVLHLDTYRNVQPLELERFFAAIRSEDAPADLEKLLASGPPALVVQRALSYAAGGRRPWPLRSWFDDYLKRGDEAARVEGLADAVEALLGRPEPDVRREAAAVLADLRGAGALVQMRRLLSDPDGDVRATAIAIFARARETRMLEAMARAAQGANHPLAGLAAVDELAAWGGEDVVPVLLALAGSDGSATFRRGDDVFSPAFRARAALLQITGVTFSTDGARNAAAWREVQGLDGDARRARLRELLGEQEAPLSARLDAAARRVVVTNVSQQVVQVSRLPAEVDYRIPGVLEGGGGGQPAGRADFVDLAPGESLHLDVTPSERFLATPAAERQLRLVYDRTGSRFGAAAWVGLLDVATSD